MGVVACRVFQAGGGGVSSLARSSRTANQHQPAALMQWQLWVTAVHLKLKR